MPSSVKLISAIKQPIWSGNRLSRMFSRFKDNDCIGEAWETSVNPDALSEISEMGYRIGFDEHLRTCKLDVPPLIKLIDAASPLSIQVHPDEVTAAKYGGVSKSEIWYVLASEKDSYILYGTKDGVSLSEVQKSIQNGTVEEIMNKVYVNPGDIFMIPTGMLHSLGGGITVLEVQDREGTTYRVKDIAGNREVHLTESADSVRIYSHTNAAKLAHTEPSRAVSMNIDGKVIASTENYAIIRHTASDEKSVISLQKGTYVFCESGSCSNDDLDLITGDSLFVGADNTYLHISPDTSVIIVY